MDTSLKNIERIGALEPIKVQINRTGNENLAAGGEGIPSVAASTRQSSKAVNKAGVDTAKSITKKEIDNAIKDIQPDLDSLNIEIAFKVDAKYNEPVVQVIRKDSGDVISQFPPEKM